MNPGCDVRDEGNGEIERNYPTSKFEQQRRNSDLCEVDYNHRSTLTDFNILSTLSEDGRYDYTESDDSMDYDTLSPKESTQKHEWSLQYEESTRNIFSKMSRIPELVLAHRSMLFFYFFSFHVSYKPEKCL